MAGARAAGAVVALPGAVHLLAGVRLRVCGSRCTRKAGARSASWLRNYEFLFADPSFQKALGKPPLRRRNRRTEPRSRAGAEPLHPGQRGALRSVLFLPVLIPLVAAASIFLFIFLPGVGLLDHYFAKLGRRGRETGSATRTWRSSPSWA
jgi:hypothetical protein